VEAQIYRNLDGNASHLRRAEQYVQRAQGLAPQLPETHLALGTVAADKYDYKTASAEFRTATQLDPQNAYAWDLLSWSLGYETPPQSAEAEKASREAMRLQPTMHVIYYHLGRALIQQKRYDEAISYFEQERQYDRDASFPELGLGQAYLAKGNYDKAIAALAKSARPSAINYYWLAAAYSARGDRDKSVESLQKAFEMGFSDFAAIDGSPYFSNVRSDPRYQQLLAKYRR